MLTFSAPYGTISYHPYASETGIIGEIEEEAAWCRAKIRTFDYHYNIAPQWDALLHMEYECMTRKGWNPE